LLNVDSAKRNIAGPEFANESRTTRRKIITTRFLESNTFLLSTEMLLAAEDRFIGIDTAIVGALTEFVLVSALVSCVEDTNDIRYVH